MAHFIPDIMPVVSSDHFQIKQMVTNTRLILGVLAKVNEKIRLVLVLVTLVVVPCLASRSDWIDVKGFWFFQCGSVRVDSVEDFAYGAEILVNPMDKVISDVAFVAIHLRKPELWT